MSDADNGERRQPIAPRHRHAFARLVAAAWSDPAVAERYDREPTAVLADFGIELAEGETAPVLPSAPGEVSVETLDLAGGSAMASIGTLSCPGSCVGFGDRR